MTGYPSLAVQARNGRVADNSGADGSLRDTSNFHVPTRFMYSARARFRIGISESPSFQSEKKSS
jgi:hypothetical protein